MKQVNENDDVLIISGKEWHEGVVGIVSARVARQYEKPCIILSHNENGILKGSGRSFGECDLFGIVDGCREHLDKFGGHEAAIGLSLQESSLEAFKAQVQSHYKKQNYPTNTLDPEVLGEIHFKDLDFNLTAMMRQYEPYGQGNTNPKFISKNVQILQADTMGKEGEHLRFSFAQDAIVFKGVKFKSKEKFSPNSTVDITYTLNENHFRGNVTLQLMVDKILKKTRI